MDMVDPSREVENPPRFSRIPVTKVRGRSADRRQVLAKHPFGSGQSPRVPARPAFAVRAPGDARLSALHRGGFLAPSPPWPDLGALHMSGALRSRIGAFARSARSGGWAVSLRRLPGARLRVVHAGRRIPLRLWLVSGDALGERDGE